jgi:haloalkane dehalogenase
MTWRSLYPFVSHFMQLPNGNRLHYLDEGAGRPVVMVHGNPTWSFAFRRLVAALRTQYRVVALDHLGCGLSDKPQDDSYRLMGHVANLERLITTLDLQQATLVVHDWGGPIGFTAALRQRIRFRQLVVFNSAVFFGPCPWRIRACRIPTLGSMLVRGANAFVRGAMRMAVAKPLGVDVQAGYYAPYNNWANRIATLRFVEDIPLHGSHPSYQAMAELEANVTQLGDLPMLIMWGLRDWCFTPWYLEQWQQRFPRAVVHPFADAHHLVFEDEHERVQELLAGYLAQVM